MPNIAAWVVLTLEGSITGSLLFAGPEPGNEHSAERYAGTNVVSCSPRPGQDTVILATTPTGVACEQHTFIMHVAFRTDACKRSPLSGLSPLRSQPQA